MLDPSLHPQVQGWSQETLPGDFKMLQPVPTARGRQSPVRPTCIETTSLLLQLNTYHLPDCRSQGKLQTEVQQVEAGLLVYYVERKTVVKAPKQIRRNFIIEYMHNIDISKQSSEVLLFQRNPWKG